MERNTSQPLPLVERMKARRQFLATAASGERWVRPAFVLQLAANDDDRQAAPQMGFTTSRKLGNAVRRNRIRRRLREAARLFLPTFLQPGYRYVLIGRHGATEADFAALGRELQEAVEKLHRIQVKRQHPAG